jgi:hypothetical protein
MRITWLEPDVIREARQRLLARHDDWAVYFLPEFRPPPAPPGMDARRWPRIAEHVARAERVGQAIREHGLDTAMERFGGSEHAIELAALISAAVQVDRVRYEMVAALLEREVDELIVYGTFLKLLQERSASNEEHAVQVYERFCAAFAATRSDQPMWGDRVDAVRDGLAGFYVLCGRHEQGHALFVRRHEEETGSLLVALTASRVFLGAGAVGRAIAWLGLGAERAERLGRPEMAGRLRGKQETLKKRQS